MDLVENEVLHNKIGYLFHTSFQQLVHEVVHLGCDPGHSRPMSDKPVWPPGYNVSQNNITDISTFTLVYITIQVGLH